MSAADRSIRIIKREHRIVGSGEADSSLKTDKEITREILNTITSWVEHQREAKKELRSELPLFQTRG
jgi:hypothetical protein